MAVFKGTDLKAWRQKFDLTQKRLSQVSGVSTLTIGQFESGLISGSAKTLAKLTKAIAAIEESSGIVKSEAVPTRAVSMAVDSEPDASSKSTSSVICLSNLDLELINRILAMKPKQKLRLLAIILGE